MRGVDSASGKWPSRIENMQLDPASGRASDLRTGGRVSQFLCFSVPVIVTFAALFVSCHSADLRHDGQTNVAESESHQLVRLTLEKDKVTPFNTLAELFDPAMSDAKYDELRNLYFDKLVRPRIGRGYSLSGTHIEFMERTERPQAGNSAFKTGLDFDEAEELVDKVVQLDSFTVGSTKDDVLAIQGTPSSVGANEWWYGASIVKFNAGHVVGWVSSPSSPLGVYMQPAHKQARNEDAHFTKGATKSEVFEVQGPPTQFSEHLWKYGKATVYFAGGRVQRWESSPETHLRAGLPR